MPLLLLTLPDSALRLVVLNAGKHAAALRSTCTSLRGSVDATLTKLAVPPSLCAAVAKAAPRLTGVEELHLTDPAWSDPGDAAGRFELERCLLPLLQAAAQHWPKLKTLAFATGAQQHISLLSYIAAFLPGRLSSLSVGKQSDAVMNAHGAALIGACGAALQQLHWGWGGTVTDPGAFRALASLTSLRELTLDSIDSEVSMAALTALAPTLTLLSMTCSQSEAAGLPTCLSGLTGLRDLEIREAHRSRPMVLQAAAGLQQLTSLTY